MNLMKSIRENIKKDTFPEFTQKFFKDLYPKGNYPQWAVEALRKVNIDLFHNNDTQINKPGESERVYQLVAIYQGIQYEPATQKLTYDKISASQIASINST